MAWGEHCRSVAHVLDLAHAAVDGSLQRIVLAALQLDALGPQLPHPQNDLQQPGKVAAVLKP